LLDCKRVTIIDAFSVDEDGSMLLTSSTADTDVTNATATGDTTEFNDKEVNTSENRHHCRVDVEELPLVVFLISMRAM
jgi:exosome complex RNA-binding protein Rrp42 (RNase PH superfamily)